MSKIREYNNIIRVERKGKKEVIGKVRRRKR